MDAECVLVPDGGRVNQQLEILVHQLSKKRGVRGLEQSRGERRVSLTSTHHQLISLTLRNEN